MRRQMKAAEKKRRSGTITMADLAVKTNWRTCEERKENLHQNSATQRRRQISSRKTLGSSTGATSAGFLSENKEKKKLLDPKIKKILSPPKQTKAKRFKVVWRTVEMRSAWYKASRRGRRKLAGINLTRGVRGQAIKNSSRPLEHAFHPPTCDINN